MLTYYFAGVETTHLRKIIELYNKGYKIKGIMSSFAFIYNDKSIAGLMAEYRKLGGKVMIDSGWLTAIHVGMKADEIEEYYEDYLKWLLDNRDSYDYAIEFNVGREVGHDKVIAWRDKYKQSGIPLIAVIDTDGGDVFNAGELDAYRYVAVKIHDDMKDFRLIRDIKNAGFSVHLMSYMSSDMFDAAVNVDSIDSSVWLKGQKFKEIVMKEGKMKFRTYKYADEPMLLKNIMKDKFIIDNFDTAKTKKHTVVNYWNMWNIQQLVDEFNERTKGVYEEIAEKVNKGELVLPETAIDKNKIKMVKERFNNYEQGKYAKMLFDYGVTCGVCPYRGSCPFAGKDDDVCYFLPYFRKEAIGIRNKETLIRRLEDIVSEKYVTWMQAKLMERLSGNIPDRAVLMAEGELLKALELLFKLKYGEKSAMTMNVLNLGDTHVVAGGLDRELENIRKQFGDELAERIKKKINKTDMTVDTNDE